MSQKTYEVIGSQEVLGHPPGSTFTDDIEDAFLLQIGAIREVEQKQEPDETHRWGSNR